MWKFQHREGQREINELHVPVNTPVRDDHHVRGRAARPVFPVVPREDRRDPRAATRRCGSTPRSRARTTSSARSIAARGTPAMIGTCVVMPQDEYQAWLGGGATEGTLAQRGEKLFTQLACVTCHRARLAGPRAAAERPVRLDRPPGERQHGDRRRGVRPRVDSEPDGEGRRRLRAASCRRSRVRSARSSCSR